VGYLNFPDIPKHIKTGNPPYCPEHEIRMRLVIPREDSLWSHFWGCTKYPDCDFSYSIDSNGDWHDRYRGFDPYELSYVWEGWY